jgi:hypothetical protein
MSIIKKGNFEIKTNLEFLEKYSPQVIYPDNNIDFFLTHYHHFNKIEGLNLLIAACVGGAVEFLPQIEPLLDEYADRVKYSMGDFFGYILQNLGPKIDFIRQQVELIKGTEEEMKKELQEQMTMFFQKPQNYIDVLNNLPFPFLQLTQEALPVFLSKYTLENFEQLNEGFGNSSVLDFEEINRIDSLFYNLYKYGVLHPIFSTSICTNKNEPHFDFIFSNKPLREGNCRWCDQPLIVFNQYLITEPYSTLKLQQKDLSHLISSYLFVKSSRQLECYPEAHVKLDDGVEEQVDVFIRNWSNGKAAIIECKIKETPQTTFDTKRHYLTDAYSQIKRKMNNLNVNYGFIVTNLIFNSIEEKEKMEKIIFKSDDKNEHISLIAKINYLLIPDEFNEILYALDIKE